MEKSKLRKITKLFWEGFKFSFAGFNWREGPNEIDIMNATHRVHPEIGYDFEILLRRANKEKDVRPRYATKLNIGGEYAIPIFDEIKAEVRLK